MSSEMVHVLSTVRFNEEQLDRLRAVSARLRLVQHTVRSADELPPEIWPEVEVLCTFGALPEPAQAPRLRWVQLLSAGADRAIGHPVFRDGAILTTASGIHAVNIGELVILMMLAWGQRLLGLIDHQRRADWPENRLELFVPQELRGASVGIVGYGSIGREVGRLASAFGMRVLALDESEAPVDRGYVIPGVGDPEGLIPDRFYHPGGMRKMLAECDYVVIAVPLTDATRNLIGVEELRAMQSSAFLINVARGGVVDEPALIQALREGWIAGAGLDVFVQEPLPSDSPLWGMENVILTPHIAGWTPHYNERAADVLAENLQRYLSGRPLLNQVDLTKGY
jgi:phosphoglycerate dehydrogenase-like enzyme